MAKLEPLNASPASKQSEAISTPVTSQTIISRFRDAFHKATTFIAEFLRAGSPSPHPEFRQIDGWHWNKAGLDTSGMATPEFKIRFFFDVTDFPQLNSLPFPVKFAPSDETSVAAEYCGFAYSFRDKDFPQIERWSAAFKKAEVFTYGSSFGDDWIPGVFVRAVAK